MFDPLNAPRSRSILKASMLAMCIVASMVTAADANRRVQNSVRGAAVGAGVGALIDGGQGPRTGAAVGAIYGAVRR